MSSIYYMYQITNLLDGKIYIGVHKTTKIDDGYMGSGLRLRRAQNKYGIENFKKEILKFFDSQEEMFKEETEVVTQQFLQRDDVYNLAEGGKTPGIEAERRGGKKSGVRAYREKVGIFSPEALEKKKRWTESAGNRKRMRKIQQLGVAAARSPEAVAKRKETFEIIKHSQGKNNSQYGKHWIHRGLENMLVKKDLPVPEGWEKGRKIKSEPR